FSSSRRRHTRFSRDWSSDVCSSDLALAFAGWQVMKPKAPKDPYRTAAVETGAITKAVSASGTLQALVTVDVGSQISGQIINVMRSEERRVGQVGRAGAAPARVDSVR